MQRQRPFYDGVLLLIVYTRNWRLVVEGANYNRNNGETAAPGSVINAAGSIRANADSTYCFVFRIARHSDYYSIRMGLDSFIKSKFQILP